MKKIKQCAEILGRNVAVVIKDVIEGGDCL